MAFYYGLATGLISGACLGYIYFALMAAAKEADRKMEERGNDE